MLRSIGKEGLKMDNKKKKPISLRLSENIEIHEKAKISQKSPGNKKPIVNIITGDSLTKKTGKWAHREMYINKKRDNYREIVIDKITGYVLHFTEELLSQHKGHGSAKKRKGE